MVIYYKLKIKNDSWYAMSVGLVLSAHFKWTSLNVQCTFGTVFKVDFSGILVDTTPSSLSSSHKEKYCKENNKCRIHFQ